MTSVMITVVMMVIQVPVILSTFIYDPFLWPPQTKLKNNTSYDYIVVGAGTAGSVVATRLAEDNKNKILLLEAGGDPPLQALIASLFSQLPNTTVDYSYSSTFDPYAAGAQGNYTKLTAGKTLGGCNTINHFVLTRGCPKDCDDWAEIAGDKSLKYKNFLEYFIRIETVDDVEILSKYPQYHGTNGPMGLTREIRPESKIVLNALEEVGHPTVLDLNAADTPIGYTTPLVTIDKLIRQTTGLSYLGKVKYNSNLYVSKYTRVSRVLFQGDVAVAVEAYYKDLKYILKATKEVIICAGVFNTPQILMLSGVGPEDHLKEMGIEPLRNLPVGKNYTDQVSTSIVYTLKKHLLSIPNPLDLITDPTQIPFPIITGTAALNKTETCPEYQVFSLLFPHDLPLTVICDTFGYLSAICDGWQKEAKGKDVYYSLLSNVIPESRGEIRLRSNDPFEDPVIITNFLTNPIDIKNMVKFVRNFIKVGNSSHFKKIDARLIGVDLVECTDKEFDSDDFWICYIKNRAVSPYHYTGTCGVGTVTDRFFKVLGFKNLRVVDASIIPKTPRGAPIAAIIAYAEKGADLIKSESYY